LVVADATGLGDPVAEDLLALLPSTFFPVVITSGSSVTQDADGAKVPRHVLIETLINACERKDISIPKTDKTEVIGLEMDSFDWKITGSRQIQYVPTGDDDTVLSLSLAVWALRNVAHHATTLDDVSFGKSEGPYQFTEPSGWGNPS
jgi:hypothetical protein